MRMNEVNAQDFITVATSTKKVGRLGFDLVDITNYLHTINQINSLEYGLNQVSGYPLSSYVIPAQIKEMIVPSKIQFVVSNLATNYKRKDYAGESDIKASATVRILDPIEFNMISHLICAVRKIDNPAVTAIDVLRESKALSEVYDAHYLKGTKTCMDATDGVFPIEIELQLNDKRAYTEGIDNMFKAWLFKKLSTL